MLTPVSSSRSKISTAPHPNTLVSQGRAKALIALARRRSKLASEFVGALGEIAAAKILHAKIVSDRFSTHDLERGFCQIEVKATLGKKPISPDLSRKTFHRYCEVRLERRGSSIWVVDCWTRQRGVSPKTKKWRPAPQKTELKERFQIFP